MPIFEFRCLACGSIFEKLFLRSDEEAVIDCPDCGCDAFERVVSKANYALGSGPGREKPKISTRSCSSGNTCMTMDIPGPTK